MIFRKDNSPIDGEKLNKLLLEIRSGKSKYIEFEVNELVRKTAWRKYYPPKWAWIPGTLFLIIEIFSTTASGKGSSIGFLIALIIFFLPFVAMGMANTGYRSFNQLKSILNNLPN